MGVCYVFDLCMMIGSGSGSTTGLRRRWTGRGGWIRIRIDDRSASLLDGASEQIDIESGLYVVLSRVGERK